MQELRIINALDFWLRLQLFVGKEKSKVFDFRNKTEIYFVAISMFNEAIKEFSNNIADQLLKQNLSENLKKDIILYKDRYNNWKDDCFLKAVHSIRNEISFHFRESVYKDYIKDGQTKEDLFIGIATSNKIIDFCYTEPYTFIFNKIASLSPEFVNNEDAVEWIQKEIIAEISKLSKLMRSILKEQIKDNGYKKYIKIDDAI